MVRSPSEVNRLDSCDPTPEIVEIAALSEIGVVDSLATFRGSSGRESSAPLIASYDRRMARRPFDPSRAAGDLFGDSGKDRPLKSVSNDPATPRTGPTILGVSALSQRIRATLEGGIGTVQVLGEISNFRAVQGHWYFSLKDSEAKLDCMMFRSSADRSTCRPVDGIAVVATGQVTHYPPQGRTQIQCSKLEVAGAGDLDAQFRQLCTELRGLGYFDESAKVPIPSFPMCIAILTSAESAAEADCFDAVSTTFPATRVIAVDIRVQGAQAAEGIAHAIAAVDRSAQRLGIEVILLVRGGGSREDLWAFNESVVADAIRNCTTPIVTGIGHESDTSIADLVADVRAATPSRAVTEILPKRAILEEQLASLQRRLARGMATHFERARNRLDLAARARGLAEPASAILFHQSRVLRHATELASGMRERASLRERAFGVLSARFSRADPRNRLRIAQARTEVAVLSLRRTGRTLVEIALGRVESNSRTLEAIGPLTVLRRGYSITIGPGGSTIRRASTLVAGESIETILADGQVRSVVERVSERTERGSDGSSLDSRP